MNWNKEAIEQGLYGNSVPPQREETVPFKARKTYVPGNKGPINHAEKKLHAETGHIAFLKKLSESSQEVIVITALGDVIRGTVKAVDEQTISIKCPNTDDSDTYRTRILFKSHIVELSPVKGMEALADQLTKAGTVNTTVSTGFIFGKTQIQPC